MKVFAWICAGLMALAVIPAYADSGCSEKHENVSRFNPTELSDYQKCVYAWAGKTSGSHAGFVWFSIDGKFHHISNDEIIAASDDGIERLIVKTILEDEVAEKLEQAQAMLELASMNERKYAAEIQELKKTISDMRAVSEIVGQFSIDLTKRTSADGVYRYSHTDFSKYGNGHTGNEYTHRYNTGTGSGTHGLVITFDDRDGTSRLTIRNSTATVLRATINSDVVFNQVSESIAAIVQAAYNEGYEDGYRAGYADGYKAGVKSVTN